MFYTLFISCQFLSLWTILLTKAYFQLCLLLSQIVLIIQWPKNRLVRHSTVSSGQLNCMRKYCTNTRRLGNPSDFLYRQDTRCLLVVKLDNYLAVTHTYICSKYKRNGHRVTK